MPCILFVDERSVYRTGLRCFVEKNIQAPVVLEASNLLHAFSLIRTENAIDLVRVDLDLSRFHSIEPLRTACEASFATRWAVISDSDSRTDILASLAAGFHGFISKHQSDLDIVEAIKDVLSGRIYVPTSLANETAPGGNPVPTILARPICSS